MDDRPNFALPQAIWGQLPQQVQELFVAMQAHIDKIEAQVRELEARLGQNSQNSSRPPSSDPPEVQRPRRRRSGRKRGGQPGHPGHHRMLYSAEDVDEVVELHPSQCEHCGMALEGPPQENRHWAHQVVELPEIKPHITEYRVHSRRCPGCGKRIQGPLPEDVPTRPYGPRLQATAAMLTGRYKVSRREARDLLDDLFGVEMSLGALSGLEEATSEALGDVVEGAEEVVREADVVNMDETSWKEADERAWLWTAVTELVSLFKIAPTRSGEVVDELLGAGFGGVVGSDRYSAYKRIPLKQRAVCLAHLERNFRSLVDRGGQAQFVGVWGLVELERVFRLWHKYKAGDIDRKTLKRRLRPIKRSFGELLEYGKVWGGSEGRGHVLGGERGLGGSVEIL